MAEQVWAFGSAAERKHHAKNRLSLPTSVLGFSFYSHHNFSLSILQNNFVHTAQDLGVPHVVKTDFLAIECIWQPSMSRDRDSDSGRHALEREERY